MTSLLRKSKLIVFCLFLFTLILICSGCDAIMSPQERRGVSPLPQNRPASWENKPI